MKIAVGAGKSLSLLLTSSNPDSQVPNLKINVTDRKDDYSNYTSPNAREKLEMCP